MISEAGALLFHGLFYHYFVYCNTRIYLLVFAIACKAKYNEKPA